MRPTVALRDGSGRLVGYLVPKPGCQPSVADLRATLAHRLPPYLLPSGWVCLDALPLTPNGKVDRAALPAAGLLGEEFSGLTIRLPKGDHNL